MATSALQTPTLRSALNPHSREAGDPYYIGDIYDRLRSQQRSPSPVGKLEGYENSYLAHVRSLSTSWHHLRYLADFMDTSTVAVKARWLVPEDQRERHNRVKLCSLEWSQGVAITRQDYSSVEDLNGIIDSSHQDDQTPHSRLIVVEDLSSTVIEALGSTFDIDPRFFRAHFGDYTWFNNRDPWIELPELASAWRQRSFFNIRFVQGRYFANRSSVAAAENQAGSFNVLRRIDRDGKPEPWPDLQESDVGMVRSKVSLYVRSNKPNESGWLGVLLLDPAVTEGYPLWGGYGSFGCPPSLRAGRVATEVSPQSLYEAFTNWATSLKPEELETTASDPAFLTSRLYLHICSEWLIVMEYATTRLSHIEWELEKTQWRGPLGLEETLSKLQPWQRRIPIYMSFIKATKYELECRQNSSLVPKVHWEDITADIDGIYERVQTLQTRVDKIMNVATAITSIEESKKAMKEARDVTRITYLAFVFVPMSFTASFLSMNQTFPSSNRVYWVFFVIALPLSTAAVLIAANWTSFEKWWKDRRQKR